MNQTTLQKDPTLLTTANINFLISFHIADKIFFSHSTNLFEFSCDETKEGILIN